MQLKNWQKTRWLFEISELWTKSLIHVPDRIPVVAPVITVSPRVPASAGLRASPSIFPISQGSPIRFLNVFLTPSTKKTCQKTNDDSPLCTFSVAHLHSESSDYTFPICQGSHIRFFTSFLTSLVKKISWKIEWWLLPMYFLRGPPVLLKLEQHLSYLPGKSHSIFHRNFWPTWPKKTREKSNVTTLCTSPSLPATTPFPASSTARLPGRSKKARIFHRALVFFVNFSFL